MDERFAVDLDDLLLRLVLQAGGTQEDFDTMSELVSEFSRRSGAPEDGIMGIVIDCFGGGMSPENVKTQLRLYEANFSRVPMR